MKLQIDTKKQIIDTAENLLLDRGYHGFSYRDISRALNIKNASIHYHFPQKTDLGVAIIQRATKRFEKWARLMESQEISYSEQLTNYCLIFKKFVDHGQQICLGGALETDFKTLPQEMQKETRLFITTLHRWLENLLSQGKKKGEFKFTGLPPDHASLISCSLQGAIQNVRVTTPSYFDSAMKEIMRITCS
jgi:TetR/AcrR family transcriptional repressor of nem operon